MSWRSAYRLALRLLPAGLRRKHGPAMEDLFARQLERARARGWLFGMLYAAAALGDVVVRGAYERVRSVRASLRAHLHDPPRDTLEVGSPAGEAVRANPKGSPMPSLATRQLLLRHAVAFAVVFAVATAVLVGNAAEGLLPSLHARGAPAGTLLQVVLLTVPHTAALTVPMAVFIAVLWVFTRLGAEGALGAARSQRAGVRRLMVPVLGAALAVAALTFGSNAEIVPRANERLVQVLTGRPQVQKADRSMTIGELRAAARAARAEAGPGGARRASAYQVEVQKKYALAAACVVLALAGMALALRFPQGRIGLVLAASCVVFAAYWICLMAGEFLADRQAVSPFVAMWTANGVLLAAALLILWRSHPAGGTRGERAVAVGG